MATRGVSESFYTDQRKAALQTTIEAFRQLIHGYEGLDIQLRFYAQYNPFFIMFIDDLLCLSQRGQHKREYQMITTKSPELYDLHRNVFEEIWNEAETQELD